MTRPKTKAFLNVNDTEAITVNLHVDGFLHEGKRYVDDGKKSDRSRTTIYKSVDMISTPVTYKCFKNY